jgi:hypothetical protein
MARGLVETVAKITAGFPGFADFSSAEDPLNSNFAEGNPSSL